MNDHMDDNRDPGDETGVTCPACGSIEDDCNDDCPALAEIRLADGDGRTNVERYRA